VYTVVMTNQKGGVGRTTIAALLAWWLMEKEKARVAVVDLHSQKNLTRTLSRQQYQLSAAELFDARPPVEDTPAGEVCVFAGGAGLANLERASPEIIRNFRNNVAHLSPAFDYCLIDTPAALGLRMVAALTAADYALCPIELDPYCIDAVTATIKTIAGVRHRYNPRLKFLGLLANRFNRRSLGLREALHALFAVYGEHVIPAKISIRLAIPEALSKGIPVWRQPQPSAREAAAEIRIAFGLLLERMRPQAQPPTEVSSSATTSAEDVSREGLSSQERITAGRRGGKDIEL
jgi:chromosome partitioning protein